MIDGNRFGTGFRHTEGGRREDINLRRWTTDFMLKPVFRFNYPVLAEAFCRTNDLSRIIQVSGSGNNWLNEGMRRAMLLLLVHVVHEYTVVTNSQGFICTTNGTTHYLPDGVTLPMGVNRCHEINYRSVSITNRTTKQDLFRDLISWRGVIVWRDFIQTFFKA